MRLSTTTTAGARPQAKFLTLVLAVAMTALSAGGAAAHLRDGMSRIVGFGHWAKVPA